MHVLFDFKMKYLQTLCIRFDNLVQMCEHFLHQSTFSMKINICGLINSIEFCRVHTTKKCSARLVFLGSEFAELFKNISLGSLWCEIHFVISYFFLCNLTGLELKRH